MTGVDRFTFCWWMSSPIEGKQGLVAKGQLRIAGEDSVFELCQ